jgi:hypothetical protein
VGVESPPPTRGVMNRRVFLQTMATLGEKTHIPVKDPVLQAMRDGASSLDFTQYYDTSKDYQMPLSHVILASPLRRFFIRKVKDPLRKVIVMVARRVPEISKKNTTYIGTHVLIDIFDKFWEHERNPGDRAAMFHAAFKMFLLEIEHDKYYRDRFNWFLEEIIKSILRGEWQPRMEGEPSQYWREDGKFGGKYSVISVLQNKKDLENLMGDDWRLK